ncbi:MAG: flippase [Microcystaceae cyanobacterium]
MLKKLMLSYGQLSTNLKKQITNISWLFTERILRLAIGLVSGILVARYLGPEQYGTYNYAISLIMLVMPLVQLGSDRIIVRELVREKDSETRDKILGTTLVIRLITTILVTIVSIGIAMYLRPQDTLFHWLVGIIATGKIFITCDVIDLWFQSQVKSKYAVLSRVADSMFFSTVKILLVQLRASLMAFATVTAVTGTIKIIGLSFSYKREGLSWKNWSVSFLIAKQLLQESWPLFFAGLATIVQARIDQVMLGQMIGDSAVGQYSVAIQLVAVFLFVPSIVCQSFAPMVTQAKSVSQTLYFHRLENIYRLMFILFLLIFIPIFLFSEPLVAFMFGDSYQEAGDLLRLFVIKLFFASFGVAKSLYITNESLFRYSMLTAILGSLVNITLNYILIPQYGTFGALYATIASFGTTIFLIDCFYPRVHKNLSLMIKAILSPWKLSISLRRN